MAFATPALHSAANILDSYFANHQFKRLAALIFFSSIANLLFMPLVFLVEAPHVLPSKLFLAIGLISVIEIAYQYPYLWSLRKTSTSVVTSLFSFGKIFTPAFAYLLVGERLTVHQYLGFLAITLCGAFLSLERKEFRLNIAFWLMLLVAVALSAQTVLYKYVFENGGSWASVLLYTAVVQAAIAAVCIAPTKNRIALKQAMVGIRTTGPLLLLGQILTWAGTVTGTLALSFIPASVVNGIEDSQALFVLAYAGILGTTSIQIADGNREKISRFKIFMMVLLFVGTVLLAIPA